MSSMEMPTSVVLSLMFNLSGIDPSAPTTTGTTFVLTPHIFFLTLPSARIALSMIWHLLFYLSVIIKSGLLAPISWKTLYSNDPNQVAG